jgi:2-phosphosulfolactate phosphatase
MKATVELLLTPAEIAAQSHADRTGMVCVVFDVLRATSTLATALKHGAKSITVVEEIQDALRLRESDPNLLLAGERKGRRISASLTGSIDFDLGNSPREFTPEKVRGRQIVMTTTNGTRALRACDGAETILATSMLNLSATLAALRKWETPLVRLVCAGTGGDLALEDVLGAGALLAALSAEHYTPSGDACLMARELYESNQSNLAAAFERSLNGARLLADPELAPDVAFCARRDVVEQAVTVKDHTARLDPFDPELEMMK